MTSGIAFDRPDRLSRLRAFPYDRFKIDTIVPIVQKELSSIQAIEVVSVVRVVCDRLGSVSMGAIHSTKIQTGPTGKRGPPQKVDQFFRNLFRLDRTDPLSFGPKFRKFWLNESRPI